MLHKKKRVFSFVDGFSLYHAIDDLRQQHLKWVNLHGLVSAFIRSGSEELNTVYYFTAYATWLADAYARHRAFVKAQEACGVEPVLGKFKNKHRQCAVCRQKWIGHEEKETDVNIAIYLIHHAYRDDFDKAVLVTSDSDLCPPIRLLLEHFPQKEMHVLVPPGRYNITRELRGLVSASKIKEQHLKRNLLPAAVYGKHGTVNRPSQYDPLAAGL